MTTSVGPGRGKNNTKVIQWLEHSPDDSYADIARVLGISRERVRQIAKRGGFPERKLPLASKSCLVCRKIFQPKSGKVKTCSRVCGNRLRGDTLRARSGGREEEVVKDGKESLYLFIQSFELLLTTLLFHSVI